MRDAPLFIGSACGGADRLHRSINCVIEGDLVAEERLLWEDLNPGDTSESLNRTVTEADVAAARQLAIYLAHVALGHDLSRLSTAFGRDRATVRPGRRAPVLPSTSRRCVAVPPWPVPHARTAGPTPRIAAATSGSSSTATEPWPAGLAKRFDFAFE